MDQTKEREIFISMIVLCVMIAGTSMMLKLRAECLGKFKQIICSSNVYSEFYF